MFSSIKELWDVIILEDEANKMRPYIIVEHDPQGDMYGIVPMTTRRKYDQDQIQLSTGSRINIPIEVEFVTGKHIEYAELSQTTISEDDSWKIEYQLNSQ